MCRRIVQETKATRGKERIVSYLPLSHVASQLLDIYFTLSTGGSCWYAQPDALKVNYKVIIIICYIACSLFNKHIYYSMFIKYCGENFDSSGW